MRSKRLSLVPVPECFHGHSASECFTDDCYPFDRADLASKRSAGIVSGGESPHGFAGRRVLGRDLSNLPRTVPVCSPGGF